MRLQSQYLNNSLQALEKVTHFDPHEPQKKLFDLGLIIKEDSSFSPEDLLNFFPSDKLLSFSLDNPEEYEEFLKTLVLANKNEKWLAVNCLTDPSPTTIQLLKQICESNTFTIPSVNKQGFVSVNLNLGTRVIFIIDNDDLENKITYPFFVNIFGQVIRI